MLEVISFRGQAGAGKSECARYVSEKYGHERISFASALKVEVYDALKGYSEYIDEDYRISFPEHYDLLPTPIRVDIQKETEEEKITWINAHKGSLGHLLQRYGTDYRRAQDPAYWIQKAAATVKTISPGTGIVFDDCRFDNEKQFISGLGGVHILVIGKASPSTLGNRDATHASEANALVSDTDDRIITNIFSLSRLHESIDLVLAGIERDRALKA